MNESSSSGNGIGFVGLLQIVFITLKLLNKIDWSWFLVLSPLWVSTTIYIIILVLVIIVAIIIEE